MPILSTLRRRLRSIFHKKKKKPPQTSQEPQTSQVASKSLLILKLPFLVLEICLRNLDLVQLIKISLCSNRARNIVRLAVRSKSILRDYNVTFYNLFHETSSPSIEIKTSLTVDEIEQLPSNRVMVLPDDREPYESLCFWKDNPSDDVFKVGEILMGLSKQFHSVNAFYFESDDQLIMALECLNNSVNPQIVECSGPRQLVHYIFDSIRHCTEFNFVFEGDNIFDYKLSDGKVHMKISCSTERFVEALMKCNLWDFNIHTLSIYTLLSKRGCIPKTIKKWTPFSETEIFLVQPASEEDVMEILRAIPHIINPNQFDHPLYGQVKRSYLLERGNQRKKAILFKSDYNILIVHFMAC